MRKERHTFTAAYKAYHDKDLEMMAVIDELHLEDSTRGTRRLRKELIKAGFKVGRSRVWTLMNMDGKGRAIDNVLIEFLAYYQYDKLYLERH